MNGFLADGGDGFTVFSERHEPRSAGEVDLDALERYVATRTRRSRPGPQNRITRVG